MRRVIDESMIETLFNGMMATEVSIIDEISPCKIQPSYYEKSALLKYPKKSIESIYEEYDYLYGEESIFAGKSYARKSNTLHIRKKRTAQVEGLDAFAVLIDYTDKVLKLSTLEQVRELQYDNKKIKSWLAVFQSMGQDIPICAYLANKSKGKEYLKRFDWPVVILPDDGEIARLIEKGLAENHFHLDASTQVFPLTWAYMMNYPVEACKIFEEMESDDDSQTNEKEYLKRKRYDDWITSIKQKHRIAGESAVKKRIIGTENRISTEIRMAAMLRVLLFRRILLPQSNIEDELLEYLANPYNSKNWLKIKAMRRCSSKEADPSLINRRDERKIIFKRHEDAFITMEKRFLRKLDYAISDSLYNVDLDSTVRILEGERSFLYHSFVNSYNDTWGERERSMLYAYILLKISIRDRYIHNNSRVGFVNFQDIQGRKNELRYTDKERYITEKYRLAIWNTIKDYNVQLLEARIGAESSTRKLVNRINLLDQQIKKAEKVEYREAYQRYMFGKPFLTNEEQSLEQKKRIPQEGIDKPKYFYTAHISRKEESSQSFRNKYKPRNYTVRKKAEKTIASLEGFFGSFQSERILRSLYQGDCRIYGLDVCSFERGCRPEAFATEFRFARRVYGEKCGFTYHVGESYESVLDGLRAVDEAVRFLEMKKGDRIGHALALGIPPGRVVEKLQDCQQNAIYLPKQDVLDDLVWFLYKVMEYGICMDSSLEKNIFKKAKILFKEIYVATGAVNWKKNKEKWIEKYYHSWMLRGDHPALYKDKSFRLIEETTNSLEYNESRVSSYKPNSFSYKLDFYRKDGDTSYLYYLYHYSPTVKVCGERLERVDISDMSAGFIKCVETLQNKLLETMKKRSICIECNPTSNFRIGGMKSFKEHPIDVFCEVKQPNKGIKVSINTDNMGVFDISLPHEYMVVKDALRDKGHTEDDINAYLEKVRGMGFEMSFVHKR